MTQSNFSNSTSGAEPSAFQSAQSALARKPLPGPRWAWPGVAVLAVAGVAYLVAGTSGEHAGHRAAPSPSAESAPPEAPSPITTTTAALEPTAPATPPAAPAAAPATPPAAPAPAAVNDLAASPAKAEAEPTKASNDTEQAVASVSATTKKKVRGAAHRAKRKRSARVD
jgi:hypothetical protein